MKRVTHLCYSAFLQTAAYRLHKSLELAGFDSQIITGAKSVNDKNLVQPYTPVERLSALTGLLRELFYRRLLIPKCKTFFSLNIGPAIIQRIWIRRIIQNDSQIVHLHWIGNGFIPLKNFVKFKKPIIWTIHDFWAITGGCHVAGGCTRYEYQCGQCPQIFSNRKYDLSTIIFNKKRRLFNKLDIKLIVPSTWMGNIAKSSALLKNHQIFIIPNAINTSVFKPLDKVFSRDVLNLSRDKKILAFGSISGISDKNKGFDLLTEAIKIIVKKRNDILLVNFGNGSSSEFNLFGCESKSIGKLSDEQTLVLVYSASDVIVVPSRQESFSQISSESIACGTPVAAFDSTGPRDIIDHKINGYLAKSYDYTDLAEGILWIIEDQHRWQSLSDNARKKAIECFSYEVVGKKHIDLYNSILKKDGI